MNDEIDFLNAIKTNNLDKINNQLTPSLASIDQASIDIIQIYDNQKINIQDQISALQSENTMLDSIIATLEE